MRYEHFLYQSKPAPWPKAVLTVSASVEWIPSARHPGREVCTLRAWHGVLCERSGRDYAVSRTASGTTADAFWALLRLASQRCSNLWIISTRFREVASVLDLWGQLESGHVRINGTDSRRVVQPARNLSDLRAEITDKQPAVQSEIRGNRLSAMRENGDETKRIPEARTGNPRGRKQGVCILEDPPIVLDLNLGAGGSKITWVDAANYGVNLSASEPAGKSGSSGLAEWFIRAASTLQSLGDCGWQATAGSQSMHLYKCEYLETPILSHTHPTAESMERAGSFGGRCECFQLGSIPGPVHLYDFRSLYPYLCHTAAVPVRLARVVSNPQLESLPILQKVGLVAAEVAIETDEPEYPYRDGLQTVYPVGRFWTHLTGQELDNALRAGHVRGVRRAAVYEAERALARFAAALYARRCACDKAGDSAQSGWLKRMMVALPGKFGQRIAQWEDMPEAESPWEWAEWYARSKSGEPERWRSLAGNVQRETKGGYSHGAIPAITAAICAAGRARLADAIACAGRENCYYCDTDSIMCNDYGAESLTLGGWVRPGEWGFLQHVISAECAHIFGVKHYRIGERIRESGRSAGEDSGQSGPDRAITQPWVSQSLRKQQRPADWRESHPYIRGPGRYDQYREPGGRVKTPVIMEW